MITIHCKDWNEIDKIRNKNGMYINDKNGHKYTFKDNELHSYNGKPAIEYSNGDKYWYRNGKYHRLYGHAIEYRNGNKSWYLFNKHYSESEYNKIIKNNVLLFYWKNIDKL